MAILRPKLKLERGKTYVIDQSDATNATHPFKFTADSGTSEYTSGVTATGTPGQAGAKTTFVVPSNAPDNMMYYCTTHGIGMGQKIKIIGSAPVTYSGGESVSGSSITHGQWRNPSASTTSNPQIYIRQQVVGGQSQSTAATNLRNALNTLQVGNTITVASPAKVFTISGGISTFLDTNTDYRVWLFDVDAQGLTNSTYFYLFTIPSNYSSSGNTWWGTRGMAIGGQQPGISNIMQYFDITSTGNAVDFGDLTTIDYNSSAGGNGSRGVRIGGTSNNTTMDYWAFATPGNAVDFGDPLVARQLSTTVADGTKAITGGSVSSGYKNDIEYITVATTGNGTDFGDLNRSTAGISSTNDTTRGVFAGDQSTSSNAMDYITMATPGNATDYGDLATALNNMLQGVVSDNTYGVFMGGNPTYSNVIQYMTIQSSSNATDFGDLTQGRSYGGQTSDATSKRGVTLGGYVNPGSGGVALNSMEYITINAPGNALDFGDLTGNNERACGVSGAAA